jgi:dGTPase
MPDTLEGQVVRISDVIAYVNHDIDDALRAEIIKPDDIPAHLIRILGQWHAYRIDTMVEDAVRSSLDGELEEITMSEPIYAAVLELRDFLYERVYFSPEAECKAEKVEKILKDLYGYVLENPGEYVKPFPESDPLEARVRDFIAGMTDLYALRLYEEFFSPPQWPLF